MTIGLVVGAGGIGSEVARLAAKSVDHLLLFDREERLVTEVCLELACTGLAGNVTVAADRHQLVQKVCGFGEPVQWVVLASGMPLRAPVTEIPAEAIQSVVDTNVVGPMALVSELLRSTPWAPGARLVGIGSISARRALPRRAVYGASKAAFEAFMVALGVELAPRGILVNVVSAGVVDTPFLGAGRESVGQWAAERVPNGRLAEAKEVAAVIVYLLTEAPGYINCARIVVDGGTEAMP
jgi:NAD(P)-dependent dehydrogenase (short-subunit alcohol dehydrogenase family)